MSPQRGELQERIQVELEERRVEREEDRSPAAEGRSQLRRVLHRFRPSSYGHFSNHAPDVASWRFERCKENVFRRYTELFKKDCLIPRD